MRAPLQPALPPRGRSRVALGLTAAAAEGRFALQVCAACGAVQYPPREACHRCLGMVLAWREQSGAGRLLAHTLLHHSHHPFFRKRVPWRLGLVQLDCGPTVLVHLHGAAAEPPARVRVGACLDRAGMAVLVGFPPEDVPNMAEDRQLREMTCDPKLRQVLVTDGSTAVGQALVRELAAAGAQPIWVGHAGRPQNLPGLAQLAQLPRVNLVPLDVTDARSVSSLAAQTGAHVDILVNNAEAHGGHGAAAPQGTELARAQMDVNYFGLLRLAQAFGPLMRARGAGGDGGAVAWVNLLSIFALANFPAHATYCASKAAAFSLAQWLRAEMQPAGVRVVNVFPGPIEDEGNPLLPPPKLSPEALSRAVVAALRAGIEDVYPGDVAQEWLARLRENPKALERELASG